MITLPNIEIEQTKNPNIIDLNNNNQNYYGPIVDTSALERGISYIGMYDTAYNRAQVNNMGIDISYDMFNQKIKFHFVVNGFNLSDTAYDEENILLCYYYNCRLSSVEMDSGWGSYSNLRMPMCYKYFGQLVQIKDITFFTDLLMEVMFLGNPRQITDEQINDNKFLTKLRDSYIKEQKLQEDFK